MMQSLKNNTNTSRFTSRYPLCHLLLLYVFSLTLFILSAGNVAYPAAVRLSSRKKSHCQWKMKMRIGVLLDNELSMKQR